MMKVWVLMSEFTLQYWSLSAFASDERTEWMEEEGRHYSWTFNKCIM